MPVRQNPLIASTIAPDLLHLLQSKNIPYQINADIRPFTTMRIGGTVSMIIVVDDEDLLRMVCECIGRLRLPVVLIGGGSNVVFPDGLSPMIVVVNRAQQITHNKEGRIRAGSGTPIRRLLAWCIKNRIGGLEFLAGIPGTIGGAAAVNAGAFGRSVSQILVEADVIDAEGNLQRVGPDEFQFSYRHSRFKKGRQTISAVFLQVRSRNPAEIRGEIRDLIRHRKDRHPASHRHTAGCFFKNPTLGDERISAGKVIAESGYLGKEYRNVRVSVTHANFLINKGEATCREIQTLEKQIVQSVRKQKNIELEREVIYIAPDGDKY